MCINVFGNSSNNNEKRIDSSLFVQKLYLRSTYLESNTEEDIDMKNPFGIKIPKDPISIRETASKNLVDNKFNNPSIIKSTSHVDFNDKKSR